MAKFRRSATNRVFGGVCGGLGASLGIEPVLLRILLVLLSFITGALLLLILYAVVCSLVPVGVCASAKSLKRYRSSSHKWWGGICGAMGEAYRLDPVFIRIIAVALTVLTGVIPLLIIYLILWAILPLKCSPVSEGQIKRLYRLSHRRWFLGACDALARFLMIDVTTFRVVFLVLLLLTGILPLLLYYFIAIAFIPVYTHRPEQIDMEIDI